MWRGEIIYVLETPVPSGDWDMRVEYTHDDGREMVRLYNPPKETYPDRAALEAFVLSEAARFDAEDAAQAALDAAAEVTE